MICQFVPKTMDETMRKTFFHFFNFYIKSNKVEGKRNRNGKNLESYAVNVKL